MAETITSIEPYESDGDAGFKVVTTDQEIVLAIDDEGQCCEEWGYLMSEDDLQKFVGAELRAVSVTDPDRVHHPIPLEVESDFSGTELEAMFIDLETDRGVLQFVAYNSHNGYYGHLARVSSKQLTHEVTL